MQNLVALLSGLMFGLGLGLSQMIDPQRVLGFLDVAGDWDPSLIFVLGGAVGVTVVAFRLVLRRSQPLFAEGFRLPTRTDIDRPLVLGAVLFGLGWGLGGYCPGPAIAALPLGGWNPVFFLVGLASGSLAYGRWSRTP